MGSYLQLLSLCNYLYTASKSYGAIASFFADLKNVCICTRRSKIPSHLPRYPQDLRGCVAVLYTAEKTCGALAALSAGLF